jgi:hypothetical protein
MHAERASENATRFVFIWAPVWMVRSWFMGLLGDRKRHSSGIASLQPPIGQEEALARRRTEVDHGDPAGEGYGFGNQPDHSAAAIGAVYVFQ